MKQKSQKFRLLCSFMQSAKMNMATDKAIATQFNQDDMPVLRLYTWQDSFSVGVSQSCEEYASYGSDCAKRMTGGGVLFHGHDLSYSLTVPTTYLEGLNVKQSYEKICTFLLCFYKKLGLDAQYAKDIPSIELSKSNFCQVGFEAYDIIVNGLKMGGNAQKRTKRMIFQHGSIPIESVQNKAEWGNSLRDVGIEVSYDKAIKLMCESFEESFDATLVPSTLNSKEKEKLKELLEDKQ
jgi:lipoate-protein ligase A